MTGEPFNVLVIGVGSSVSQGILKALALSRLPCTVVAAGVHPMDFGLHTGHRAYICPWAHEPPFMDWLVDLCRKEHIRAVLSGAESVVRFLSDRFEALRERTGAVAIVSDPPVHAVGEDKLLTCQWLERQGFPAPACALSEDRAALRALAKRHGFPLIAKPRRGGGSRGLMQVNDAIDLDYIGKRPGFVVQECLGDVRQEYTVGCFCDRDGRVRGTIAMRRELQEGATIRAVTGAYPEVAAAAERIAAALKPRGPCNIQMRMANGRAVCFELNVRFSGTTPIRARLGFNEVEAALRHYALGEPAADLPRITQGMAVRYLNELYVDPQACAVLHETGALTEAQGRTGQLEDYGLPP